jgi:hypothetical protein
VEELTGSTSTVTVCEAAGRSVLRMSALGSIASVLRCPRQVPVYGLTAIFSGAFWPVVAMGSSLEAGKLTAVAWLGRHWRTAPRTLAAALVSMVTVLTALNAVGAYGFLTRAHLDHVVAGELAVSDRAADVGGRVDVQAHVVANLDKQLGHRSSGAMRIADEQRRARADLNASRQREARTLANLQVEQARVDGRRKRAAADVGPVRYLAALVAGPEADLEHAVRLLTLAMVLVLDPIAVLLLIAATPAGLPFRPHRWACSAAAVE